VSHPYRVEWRWVAMGPLLGFFCGLVTVGLLLGVPLLLSAPLAALVLVTPVAVVVGGPIGASVGLVAGLPLALLVGSHLPLAVAARRARLLGAALPPVVMTMAVAWVPDAPWIGFRIGPTLSSLGPYPYVAAAVLGAITSEITARVDMPRAAVS
jgi:hypothetical protein